MYWGSQLVPPNESNQLDLNLTQIMKVQGQIPDLTQNFDPDGQPNLILNLFC